MKQTLLPPNTSRGSRVGAILLAASLLAGPSLASPSAAVEPSPTAPATASPAKAPTTTATPAPRTTTPAPAPAPAPSPSQGTAKPAAPVVPKAPASVPPATPGVPKDQAAMAAAVGPGGAEMGQRSARVAGSAKGGRQSAALEALTTQGTWSPSFGIKGLDVSGHQPSVNWQQQWNMGARFAYVKASEGNYLTNDSFSPQYLGSRSVGMIRGAYHFAIPNWSSGADQARYFVRNGGGWSADGNTLPPVLDFEFNPYEYDTISGFYFGNTCYDMSPAQLASWVRDFGNTMRSLTGRLPVIYTNTGWWNYCLGNPAGFGDYPLWVAAYPLAPTDDAGPVPSASWSTYSMWQYSSTGPFAGDSNVWNGDYASLQKFAGAAAPTGAFDELSLARNGTEVHLRARGWSVDLANESSATQAHVYVTDPSGKTTGYAWQANTSRPDVNQAFGYGASHGFDGTVRITASGTYKVCAHAIGASGNAPLGCKSVQASGVEAPVGAFDSVGQVRTPDKVSLQLKGWAADPSRAAVSSFADAYVTDPTGKTTGYRMTANVARQDVAAATGLGLAHGFDTLIDVQLPGTYRACVHAIGQNANVLLSCKAVTIGANPAPMGAYDSLAITQAPNSANLQVTGWALDPTRPAASIPVHIYVQSPNGTNPGYAFTANQARPDVTRALGTVGNHGFQASVALSQAGTYRVCAYAIPAAPVSAGNTLLGCRSIAVGRTPATMGSLDSVSLQTAGGQTSVRVSGWTLDPAFPASSNPAHVYVTSPDGTRRGLAYPAGLARPDVNRALGTIGNHGYSASIPVTQRGQYQVCAYGVAVSKLSAGNSLLGCRSLRY